MATKMFYVTRDMKHPLYRGRMLRAGEPLELDGPAARLYKQLNAITDEKPKAKRAEIIGESTIETANKAIEKAAPKPKRAPRKRAAKKK